jgi:hypothetical protein
MIAPMTASMVGRIGRFQVTQAPPSLSMTATITSLGRYVMTRKRVDTASRG